MAGEDAQAHDELQHAAATSFRSHGTLPPVAPAGVEPLKRSASELAFGEDPERKKKKHSWDMGPGSELSDGKGGFGSEWEARTHGPVSIRGDQDKTAFAANDVSQGAIGDCYLMAALASVANAQPGLLDRAIKKEKFDFYRIRLFVWRENKLVPHYFHVQSNFPADPAGLDAANPNAASYAPHAMHGDKDGKGQSELWVRLFEKAYAFMKDEDNHLGSYANIAEGGWMSVALEALTGEPHAQTTLNDAEGNKRTNLKADIIGRVKTREPLTAYIMHAPSAAFAVEHELVAPHAYTIMSATEDQVVVRNPWGDNGKYPSVTLTWEQFYEYFTGIGARDHSATRNGPGDPYTPYKRTD